MVLPHKTFRSKRCAFVEFAQLKATKPNQSEEWIGEAVMHEDETQSWIYEVLMSLDLAPEGAFQGQAASHAS